MGWFLLELALESLFWLGDACGALYFNRNRRK